MKKTLFVSLLFLLKVSNTNAQLIGTNSTKTIIANSKNIIVDKQLFAQQIESFQIKKEEVLSKRRNRGKNKRKSKVGVLFLNFAEHNFRVFTC